MRQAMQADLARSNPGCAISQIAEQLGNSPDENARLFAMTSIAMADASVAAWEAKYGYDLWRPITGIREAEADGNPDTEADPDWIPLGAPGGGDAPDFTPPFPAYVSGHATFGAAAFRSLEYFYGTRQLLPCLGGDAGDRARIRQLQRGRRRERP